MMGPVKTEQSWGWGAKAGEKVERREEQLETQRTGKIFSKETVEEQSPEKHERKNNEDNS